MFSSDTVLQSRPYGSLSTGEKVEAWTLGISGGLEMEVLTYGGIVTSLLVPDRLGNRADVVLGYNHLEPYLWRHPYFGAITGRVAGRITGARFHLGEREYELARNEGAHHLHGGKQGLDRRIWTAAKVVRIDSAPSLQLTYHSPDGQENYPGNVDLKVTYTITRENQFIIETETTTDQPTPINLTNHSYFNLAGEGSGDVLEHALTIHADTYFPTAPDMSLLDVELSVAGKSMDFNTPTLVGHRHPASLTDHGMLYRARRGNQETSLMACLKHSPSGRIMSVKSSEPMIQLYTGVFLSASDPVGKSGRSYGPAAGLCLECHDYPNGANAPHLGDIILHPGNVRRQTTIHTFSNQTTTP